MRPETVTDLTTIDRQLDGWVKTFALLEAGWFQGNSFVDHDGTRRLCLAAAVDEAGGKPINPDDYDFDRWVGWNDDIRTKKSDVLGVVSAAIREWQKRRQQVLRSIDD